MSKRIEQLIKEASSLTDKSLSRQIRKVILESYAKDEQDGIFQQYRGNVTSYDTREHFLTERGGKEAPTELYGVGYPDRKKTDLSTREYDRSLSTRYVPDKAGVQGRRISDGVMQDPVTNKIYDWNEGFKTEDGETFNGGAVSLQSDIISHY